MKRYYDLNEEELLNLSDEDTNRLIDYECAEDGVAFLPPKPVEPQKPEYETDLAAYSIGSWYFIDHTAASAAYAALTAGTLYDDVYHNGNFKTLKVVEPKDYGYPQLKTEKFISNELYAQIGAELEAYDMKKKEYDADKKMYDKAYEGRKHIVQAVYEAISEARNNQITRARLREDFARYLNLAEGNATIALNFLLKAKPEIEEDYPELLDEFKQGGQSD